jgi:hypothetical protein
MWGNEPSHPQVNSPFGNWSHNGFPNFQKAIIRVKTDRFEGFFISLKRYWNLDVKICLHDPFWHLKHKLWPKERSKVKLAIWLPIIKSQESSDFLMCRWHATYRWKALDEGYNFASDLIEIKGFHAKLQAPKITRIPVVSISRNLGVHHIDGY